MIPRSWQTASSAELTHTEIQDALCRRVDPEIFYEAGRGQATIAHSRERRAKAVCALCTIQPRCLEVALAADEPWGIWGGMTAPERARLKEEVA